MEAAILVDRPVAAGGGGLGFNGGQLFYLAVAACWSNDLYREAATMGIVRKTADGDFPSRAAVCANIDSVSAGSHSSTMSLETTSTWRPLRSRWSRLRALLRPSRSPRLSRQLPPLPRIDRLEQRKTCRSRPRPGPLR